MAAAAPGTSQHAEGAPLPLSFPPPPPPPPGFRITHDPPDDAVHRWCPLPRTLPCNLPEVSGHSAVVHGQRIILFGGVGSGYLSNVYVFDIETGQCWQPGCKGHQRPMGVFGHSATLVPGALMPQSEASATMIVHGGKLDEYHVTNQTFALEIHATFFQWREVRRSSAGTIPLSRWGHSAILLPALPKTSVWRVARARGVGARIVIFGGDNGREMKNDLVLFDPATAIWMPIEIITRNAPRPRRKHAAGIHGSCMYIFGGRASDRCLQDVWRLNLDTLMWQQVNIKGSVPHPRTGHTCVWHRGRMVVFGGFDYDTDHASLHGDTLAFDPLTQDWTPICTEDSSTALPAHSHESGTDPSPNTSSIVSFPEMQAIMLTDGRPRRCVRPYPRSMAAAALLNDRMYIFGGRDRRQGFSCAFYLPLESGPCSLRWLVLQYIVENAMQVNDAETLPASLLQQFQSASPSSLL
eukprot:GGOE01003381.1.p1 GENE.GGOE01003381.1~~GGOE01003381.1.p1  ORF type:complete len:466 (+),score=59.18 GGOE01003381.1:65-1462(+)